MTRCSFPDPEARSQAWGLFGSSPHPSFLKVRWDELARDACQPVHLTQVPLLGMSLLLQGGPVLLWLQGQSSSSHAHLWRGKWAKCQIFFPEGSPALHGATSPLHSPHPYSLLPFPALSLHSPSCPQLPRALHTAMPLPSGWL